MGVAMEEERPSQSSEIGCKAARPLNGAGADMARLYIFVEGRDMKSGVDENKAYPVVLLGGNPYLVVSQLPRPVKGRGLKIFFKPG